MAEKPDPVKVIYCGVCGLPAEYCEFGPDFDKCKPWLIQHTPDLYPDLVKEVSSHDADKVSGELQSTSISAGASSTSKPEEVKRLPGGKVKKKDKQEVVIEKVVRNKRKCITAVKGLDLFGVKLSEASKKLGKKFATGASVVKGPTDKEHIDVQGDISFDIVEFITDTWPDVIHLLMNQFAFNSLPCSYTRSESSLLYLASAGVCFGVLGKIVVMSQKLQFSSLRMGEKFLRLDFESLCSETNYAKLCKFVLHSLETGTRGGSFQERYGTLSLFLLYFELQLPL